MSKSKASDQKQTDILADFCWQLLQSFFGESKKACPPVWLFLSPQSKGSLKKRTEEEKAFIHFQQGRDGGATLKSPPAAWVSHPSQVPEEVAHLYAVIQKPEESAEDRDAYEELFFMTIHECFGRLGHCLVLGLPKKRTKRSEKKLIKPEELWNLAHEEGYFLGEKMAEAFFNEKLRLKDLQAFFKYSWQPKDAEKSLQKIYKLLKIKSRKFH